MWLVWIPLCFNVKFVSCFRFLLHLQQQPVTEPARDTVVTLLVCWRHLQAAGFITTHTSSTWLLLTSVLMRVTHLLRCSAPCTSPSGGVCRHRCWRSRPSKTTTCQQWEAELHQVELSRWSNTFIHTHKMADCQLSNERWTLRCPASDGCCTKLQNISFKTKRNQSEYKTTNFWQNHTWCKRVHFHLWHKNSIKMLPDQLIHRCFVLQVFLYIILTLLQ